MLLPHVTAFNADHVIDRLSDVAGVIGIEPKGSKASQAERVIRKIEEWTADLNIPQNLKTFGVSKEDVPSLAEAAATSNGSWITIQSRCPLRRLKPSI